MSRDKRLVFTLTSGRSGTQYLAHLLEGLPDVAAEHEPLPHFHGQMPAVKNDPEAAKKFLVEHKLPYIYSLPQSTYVETSHYFGKGFVEPMVECGTVPDVILLRRDFREVASSLFLIGASFRERRWKKWNRHLIRPDDRNFLPVQGWERWNDYQACYWYALANYFRTKYYAQYLADRGARVFTISFAELASGRRYGDLLEWLGVPAEVAARRVNDQKLLQKVKNRKKRAKLRNWPRRIMLAGLNLNELEAEVRRQCGLSEEPKIVPAAETLVQRTAAASWAMLNLCLTGLMDVA